MYKYVKSIQKLQEISVWKHGVMQAHGLFWHPTYLLAFGKRPGNAKARTITEHRHTPKMCFSVMASKAQTIFSTH